jgi:hypothetical protein
VFTARHRYSRQKCPPGGLLKTQTPFFRVPKLGDQAPSGQLSSRSANARQLIRAERMFGSFSGWPVRREDAAAINQSISNQSVINQQSIDQSTINQQSISHQSSINKSISNQSVINQQSISHQSSINQSISNQSVINQQSISNQSAINQSTRNQSTSK